MFKGCILIYFPSNKDDDKFLFVVALIFFQLILGLTEWALLKCSTLPVLSGASLQRNPV